MNDAATHPKSDLTQGPVAAHLRRQATPMALGLVAIFSFEAIDLYFISKLGTDPLTAVSFALPVIWLVYGIGIGFEAGAASCVSRAVGRKESYLAQRITTDGCLLGLMVALAMTALGLAFIDPVFRLLGATPELMPLVRDYMKVWYWVAPLDMVLWVMLASIRARGNTLFEAKVITAAALLNLVLDPIFIFGLFGFPRLEVAGAALATVVSTLIMLIYATWHSAVRQEVFTFARTTLAEVINSWKHLMQIALPAVITNAIIPVSSGIVVAIIATQGLDAVAGFGIAMRIEPMALIPFYALSAVSSPFFGQNIGSGNFDRLLEARRVLARFCFGFGLALALVVSLAAPSIAALYTDSESISTVAVHYIWLVSWSWGAYGLVMSVNASFNGSGRPFPAVVLSTCRVIVVLLPLIYIGMWFFDLSGLFAAIALANLMLGAIAYAWLGAHINRSRARSGPISAQPNPES